MKVLLVTTSTNAVRTALKQDNSVELIVIECTAKKSVTLEMIEQICRETFPDILITYRCPYILPKRIFGQARLGAYNIHPSLLPKYAGQNPWHEIFLYHEREGGVTLHRMTEQVDAGRIICQSSFLIEESDTIDSARLKSDKEAAKIIKRFISDFYQTI